MYSAKASFQMQHMIFEILRQAQDDSVFGLGALRQAASRQNISNCGFFLS